MPQHTAHYHWVSCSQKIQNLLQPICPAVSEAHFGDVEEALEKILASGWTRTANGKDFLCPQHSKESVDPPAKAPRKSRGVATPGPDDGSQGLF
jgi:hypothetical protein